MKQKTSNIILERIIVVSDGRTDKTFAVVKSIKDKRIEIIHDNKRNGKSSRLNQIYALNKSDLLATFDADVLLGTNNELEIMSDTLIKNPKIQVVAGRIEMTRKTSGFFAKIISINHEIWARTVESFNNGNNIHTSHGSAYMMKEGILKRIKFPKGTTCDQGFIYTFSKNGEYFFANKTRIRNNPTTSISEMRKGASRMFSERNNLVIAFGEQILDEYKVPFVYRLKGLISVFFTNPIFTILAVAYNILIPYFQITDKEIEFGLWSISKSTKNRVIAN